MKHEHPWTGVGALAGSLAFIIVVMMAWVPSEWDRQTDRRLDALEAHPITLSAAIAPPTIQPTVMTYEQWRASEPRLIATRDEAETALIEAGMTPRAAASLSWLAANCEAPVRDRGGESIGINLSAVGDNGLAHGVFQIREDAHPWSRNVYMADLNESAAAATRVWLEAGRSLSPWSCR